jgi:hypothetical protein
MRKITNIIVGGSLALTVAAMQNKPGLVTENWTTL